MKTKSIIAAVIGMAAVIFIICVTMNASSPALSYATYLGTSGADGINNWVNNISIDKQGTVFFASSVYQADFPITENAFDSTYNGGNRWGEEDVILVQFNIEQNKLLYSSYFGGAAGPDFVSSAKLYNNRYYLVGNTGSPDLPVTINAYDKTFNGPEFRHSDGYLARFENNKLSLLTYLGTSGTDWMQEVFTADNGEIIVVGIIKEWSEFPITHSFSNEKPSGGGNAVVIRLNPAGDTILSSTLLGQCWYLDADRDSDGNIYIAGSTASKDFPVTSDAFDTSFNGGESTIQGDIFVTKLSPTGDRIIFSTFLGGSKVEGFPSLCLDADGTILVWGSTGSTDFPITDNAFDNSYDGEKESFLSRLSSDGKKLLYSSFVGGNEHDQEVISNVVVSKTGDIYISGATDAEDYPTTSDAIQRMITGKLDIFISVFDSDFSMIKYSTFLGGSGSEVANIAVSNRGDIVGVGYTGSTDFPTTPDAYSLENSGKQDIIIFKISR